MANRLVDFNEAVPVPVAPKLAYRLQQNAAMERIRRGKATASDYLWALPNEFVERMGNALVSSALSGLTLPGDVMTGKVKVPLIPSSDPAASSEIVRRSLDLTGLMASGTLAAPRGAIGAGAVLPEKKFLRPVPEGSFELYHGSPYDFNQFSSERIGSGEGKQAEGYGINLTGDLERALSYKNREANWKKAEFTAPDGTKLDRKAAVDKVKQAIKDYREVHGKTEFDDPPHMEADRIVGRMQEIDSPDAWIAGVQQYGGESLAGALALKGYAVRTEGSGRIYQVKVHADPDEFLDLSKPSLAQQSPVVQERVRAAGIEDEVNRIFNSRKVFTTARTARILDWAGIVGLKGDKTHVVFDPNNLSIMSKHDDGSVLFAGGKGSVVPALLNARPLRSALAEAVDRISMKSAPAEQWVATLKNTPGVKSEEMDWTGLNDMLGKHKAPLSKAELSEYLSKNQVLLEEHWKGGGGYGERGEDGSISLGPTAANEAKTKFHQYQLPGGTNYRELVLTLPQREVLSKAERADWDALNSIDPLRFDQFQKQRFEELQAKVGQGSSYAPLPEYRSSHWGEPNPLLHVRMNDRMIGAESPSYTVVQGPQGFMAKAKEGPGSVGPFPNLTAADEWVKKNSIPRPGHKTLFLEEVQSDWHQAGRKQGYKVEPVNVKDWSAKVDPDSKEWLIFNDEGRHVGEVPSGFAVNEVEALHRWASESGKGVPDAPFKKTWPDLALKRMVQEAVDHGYDQIAWTDGATQAERYDLSKQLDAVEYLPKDQLLLGIKRGEVLLETIAAPDKLADHIGKEAAQKLLESPIVEKSTIPDIPNPVPRHILSGLDLKVGGEGMKGFYDNILPKTANKLFGKMGGKIERQKMKTHGLGGFSEYLDNADGDFKKAIYDAEADNNMLAAQALRDFQRNRDPDVDYRAHYVHVLPITPQMRAAVSGQGLPLFSAGVPLPSSTNGDKIDGRHIRFVPVEGNPFE